MLLANGQLTGVSCPSSVNVIRTTSFLSILLNFVGSLLNVFTRRLVGRHVVAKLVRTL